MGAFLGTMVGSCVGSCAVGACCSACSCQCLTSPGCTTLLYVMLVGLSAVAGLSLRYGGVDLNVGFSVGLSGPSVCVGSSAECEGASLSICNSENCQGYWAVYRISFTLAGFFALMAIGTACATTFATKLHRGYWFAKVAVLVCAFGGSLFAPNDVFAYYAWVARFAAPLFLIYQFIAFIDMSYSVNSKFIEKDERNDVFFGLENEGFKYHGAILFLAFLEYAGALTAIGLMYAHWPQSCGFNPLAITTTLLFGLGNTAVAISKVAEHGSILTSGLIFAYSTWLCYAAISAFPDTDCNPMMSTADEGSAEHTLLLIVSIIVAGGSCGYFAFRMGSGAIGGNAMTGGPSKAPELELMSAGPSRPTGNDQVAVTVVNDDASSGGSKGGEDVEPASFLKYHLGMVILSMYMAMLLTDWGVAAEIAAPSDAADAGAVETPLLPNGAPRATMPYSVGYASAWLQLGANWLCCLLYLWTLVAPKLFPDRDFS